MIPQRRPNCLDGVGSTPPNNQLSDHIPTVPSVGRFVKERSVEVSLFQLLNPKLQLPIDFLVFQNTQMLVSQFIFLHQQIGRQGP